LLLSGVTLVRHGRLSFHRRLSTEYKKNSWLRTTFGLTFLDPQNVSECFIEDLMSKIPEGSTYFEYTNYLTDN